MRQHPAVGQLEAVPEGLRRRPLRRPGHRRPPSDGDAPHYLGDDYPFYARSLAAADLEMALATAAAGFGGPDWARARDIMAQVAARSTDAHVCAEFRLMIEEVIA